MRRREEAGRFCHRRAKSWHHASGFCFADDEHRGSIARAPRRCKAELALACYASSVTRSLIVAQPAITRVALRVGPKVDPPIAQIARHKRKGGLPLKVSVRTDLSFETGASSHAL
jgi:hypothetical protein